MNKNKLEELKQRFGKQSLVEQRLSEIKKRFDRLQEALESPRSHEKPLALTETHPNPKSPRINKPRKPKFLPMTHRREHHIEERRRKAADLKNQGCTKENIARKLQISISSVRNYLTQRNK